MGIFKDLIKAFTQDLSRQGYRLGLTQVHQGGMNLEPLGVAVDRLPEGYLSRIDKGLAAVEISTIIGLT
jgi:hypothetical protein